MGEELADACDDDDGGGVLVACCVVDGTCCVVDGIRGEVDVGGVGQLDPKNQFSVVINVHHPFQKIIVL